MLSAIPDPFDAYSSANGSSSSSLNGQGTNPGEIFSILQNSAPLGQGGPSHYPADRDVLTPAGLLSPRAPSAGLPRSPPAPRSTSSATQRDSMVSSSNSLASPRLNAVDGSGPGGEISFAALGLTSATHPQAFATPTGLGSTGSIGSPLFGSEDGSQEGEAQPSKDNSSERFANDPIEDPSRSDITQTAASTASTTLQQDPRTPTRKSTSGSKKKKNKGKAAASSAAVSQHSDSGLGGGGGASATMATARPMSASTASIGLSQRLKKALSIIDDRPEGESKGGVEGERGEGAVQGGDSTPAADGSADDTMRA